MRADEFLDGPTGKTSAADFLDGPGTKAAPDVSWSDNLRDIVATALKIGPTALKGVADLGRLATGDHIGVDTSNAMKRGMEAIDQVIGSDALNAQKANINQALQDPNVGIADLPGVVMRNPRAAADTAVSTVGSMFLPAGAAAGVVKTLPTIAKIIPSAASVTPGAAATGASVVTGAAQNAAETFVDTEGQAMGDRYKGAGISGAASLVLGKLLGGGAEGVVARRLAGETVGRGVIEAGKSAVKTSAKEFLQEGGEESSNYIGKQTAKGDAIDLNAMGKQGLYGGMIGLGVGAGSDVATNAASIGKGGIERQVARAIDEAAQGIADRQTPQVIQQTVARIFDKLPQRPDPAPAPQPDPQPLALGFDPDVRNPQPTMQVDPQGNASPMPSEQQAAIQAEVERMNSLGLTPDVQRAAAQRAQSPEPGPTSTPSDLIQRLLGSGWTPPQQSDGMVLQNRNRATPSSIAQMTSIAANPDYGRLGFSRDFANGAPVVSGGSVPSKQIGKSDVAVASDGRRIPVQYAVVEADQVLASNKSDGTANVDYGNDQVQAIRAIAGNGRIAGLQSAYANGKASGYLKELSGDALHGIDKKIIKGMKQPVLVRIMPKESLTADIGDVSNTVGNLTLSPVEQAKNDAQRVSLDALQFAEDGSVTPETVRQFVRAMPQSEQGGLLDTNGQPTKQAVDRISAAVFARAYGNDQLVRLYAQAQDPEARLILSALSQVAPKMARLEGAGALDIRDVVTQAAEIAVNARRDGIALAKAAQQLDMTADPLVGEVLDLFVRNSRSVKPVVEALGAAADMAYTEANKPASDMFGEVPRASRGDIINQLRPENERGSQKGLEQPARREPVQEDAGGQAARPAGSQDAGPAQASRPAEDQADQQGLTSYTPQEIEDRLTKLEQAEKERQQQERESEQRAQADAQRDDFTLTGSDRTADVAAARGQTDIFSAPSTEQDPQAPIPTPGMTPSEAIVNAFKKEGSTEADAKEMAKRIQKLADRNGKAVTLWWNPEDGELAAMGSNPFENGVAITTVEPTPDPRAAAKPDVSKKSSESDTSQQRVAAANKPTSKIGDFGEKIGGARKDVWATFQDQLGSVADDDIANQPFSKIWPQPDYQALLDGGADPWAVAFARAARDEIPSKPRQPGKVKSWAGKVSTLRDMTMKLMDGRLDVERAKHLMTQMTSLGMRDLAGRVELYTLVGHSKSLDGVRIRSGEYSMYNRVEYKPPRVIWTVEKEAAATAFSNWPRELASGATREEALKAFKEKYDALDISPAAKKGTTFEIYARGNPKGYWVAKKVGRNPIYLAGPFENVKAARDYRASNQAELVAKLEKAKEIPRERRDTNEPRVGEDMRDGQDVTPQMFGETFGFRGVEFGNWVEQGRRQKDLNDAFDALMDMAAIIGVPPKALSLNGELGLAFGARGGGGVNPAAAHYERDKIVINLTKKSGAGSLGHEWWHALDNYFSRMRGLGDEMLTSATDVRHYNPDYPHKGKVRKEMVEAFGAVMKSIRETAIKARSAKLDAKRSKEYWTTDPEMSARAFESYLISKLQDQEASNDYLANIVAPETWKAAEALGFELDDSYPYPTAGEIPAIRAGFDHFFQTVETRETDKGVALFNTSRFEPGSGTIDSAALDRVIKRVTSQWKGGAQTVVVASTFDDLPAPILAHAQKQGYDNASTDERITGVAYRSKVYLVQENIPSEALAEETLFHERVHQVLRGNINDPKGEKLKFALASLYRKMGGRAGMQAMAKEAGVRLEGLRKQSANLPLAEQAILETEEFLAELEGRRAYEALPDKLRRMLGEYIGAIRAWLRDNGFTKMASALRQDLDQVTLADLRYMLRGLRSQLPSAGSDAIRFMTAFHGASNASHVTDSDAFKRWFGDSKVVDSDGKPLVVYHGTGADFSTFDRSHGKRANLGDGFYFSPDPTVASAFAGKSTFNKDGGNVMPVYLSLQNPAIVRGADSGAELAGHDGIIKLDKDGKIETIVVFRPEQIKSAIGNNGEFDGDNTDIRFNRKQSVQSAAQTWDVTEPGTGDAFVRAIQNNKIDVKRVRDAIAERYGKVAESKDAYLGEELYHGRVAARVSRIYDEQVEPLLKKIAVAGQNVGVTMDDVNQYLHARHAPERNAAMKAINPGMEDNDALSGMSDQEAAKVLADFKAAGKDKALALIAADVDQLLADTRTNLVADGLEDAGVVAAWETAYKHYVPLQRDIKSTGTPKGMGFSIRGPESKRAVGSNRQVVNILANIVAQAETGAIRAEKAVVGRTLLAMAKQYPNPDFWKVDIPPTKPRIDKDTGLVIRSAVDPLYQTADNVVMVKHYGQEHFIVFSKDSERAMAMAHAMKNLDIAPMNKILEVANKGTRFLASLLTQRNPLFWMTNFARDIQGALLNLEGTDAEGLQREALTNLPKAFKGMHAIVRGTGGGQWARYASEFKEAGGTTGYMQVFENSDKRMADLEREVDRMQQGKADPRRLARMALEFVDDYNDIIENAVRLSVFQAARDANVSTAKAASIAKNITVNFNRKGNLTPPINSLYMFFNASVQGTARLAQALVTSRKAQALVGGIAVMGFVLDALNRMASGDDDETKRNRYDLIPEFEKSRNWIFMNPMRPGEYVKVPLPLGPHVFHNAGRLLSDAIFRKNPRNASEYGWSIAGVFLDAFSPLGASPSLGQLIAPSVLDPAVQIAENKSFTGAPVYKSADKGFGKTDPKPAYTRHFESTPDVWIGASKLLSDATGGDKVKPGAIDINPDVMKHIFYTMTGGPGRTLDQTIDMAQAGGRGNEFSVNRVPLASRFYGANDDAQRERAYYDDRKRVLDAKQTFDYYIKNGRADEARKVAAELGDGDPVKGRKKMLEFSAAEKSVRKVNGSIRQELERDDDGEAKSEQLRALRQRRMRVMSNTLDDE